MYCLRFCFKFFPPQKRVLYKVEGNRKMADVGFDRKDVIGGVEDRFPIGGSKGYGRRGFRCNVRRFVVIKKSDREIE